MSISSGFRLGSGVYGTGYSPTLAGLRTLSSAQTSAPLSALSQGAAPEMPNLAETDPSLLRRAADVGLGGIAAAGNLLDLPSSVLRDVATWLPGGIPAQNPFDQLLTPFTDANRTRGEDILANAGLIGSDPTDSVMTNVGRWAAGTGLEILTDPLTWMTGGIWGALKGGGKIASKAGILDRATDIASSKLDRVVGYREANQVVNLRELISSAGPASHSSVLHAYNAGLKKGAPRAASLEDLPVNILDEALGANLGFKLPYAKELFFNDLKLGPMKVSGQSIAKLGDTAGHAVRASYPVRLAASLVSPALRNVKEFVNQVAASKISRDVEESERIARETVLPFVDIADTAGWFKGDQALTNSNLFYDYLEGVADSSALSSLGRGGKSVADAVNDIPEAALKGQGLLDEIDAVQGVPTMITASMRAAAKDLNVPIGRRDKPQEVIDRIRSAVDSEVETARIINGDPTPLVDNMLEIQKQLRDRAEEASTKTGVLGGTGIKVKVFDPESKKALVHPDNPLLALADPKTGMAEIPSPVRYFTRVAQMDGGAAWGKAGGRRFPQSDRFGIEREDPYRIYAYSDINNISIDPEVAGIFDKGQFGARDKLRAFFHGAPDTGVLGSTPVTDERYQKAYKLFRTKLDPYKRIDPDMLKGLDGAPIKELEQAIEKRHRDLFKRISERNRDEVLKKQTLYINDPTEALLARAESGMANAAVVEGTRRLVSSLAKLRADSPFADAVNTPAAVPGVMDSVKDTLSRAFDAAEQKVPGLGNLRPQGPVLTPKQIEAAAAGRNTDAASLPDFIRAAGMDWDKGKTALVRELGEPASRVQSQITAAKQTDEANALSSLLADSGVDMTPDSIIADLADPDTARALRESLLDIQHDNSTKIAKKTKALIEEDGQLTDRLFATVDEVLSEFEIDSTLGADIARMNQNYSAEEEVGAIMSAFDTFTSFWKGNVTAPFPSFHARNAFGGFVQNLMNGVFDPSVSGPARYAKPYKDAWALLRGDKEIKGISNIEYFKQQGLSDREATKQLRYMISSLKLVDSPGEHQSLVGATQKVSDKLFGKRTIREKFAKPEGSTFWQRSNPLNVQSIKGEDLWTPIRIGRQVGDTTESMLRGSAFIAFLRQGIDPVEAVARANRIHVDYSNLTRAERKIARRAVPFYSFQKGMTSYVASELAGRPGGPMSMSLRASANASGNDPGAPSHIRASFNVPLRTLPDGSKQYFVGADLMHEPPVEMLGTNVGETLFNMASMMHPIPKAVIERTTNASLFQEGPYGGGRSLDSLDPLLGRVLSNVGNTLGLTDRKSPVKISSSTIPEQVISNSPASRYLTEIRRLFDPRTDMVTKGLQAFTGARFATIAPEAQDAVLREQIENLMREAGGRSWQHTFMPENILESMQGDELQRVLEYQKLLRQINQRQQFRKKAAAPN